MMNSCHASGAPSRIASIRAESLRLRTARFVTSVLPLALLFLVPSVSKVSATGQPQPKPALASHERLRRQRAGRDQRPPSHCSTGAQAFTLRARDQVREIGNQWVSRSLVRRDAKSHPCPRRLHHFLRARSLARGREAEIRQRPPNRRRLGVLEAGYRVHFAVPFPFRCPARRRW